MKNKKKIMRLIDIVFWIYILIQMVYETKRTLDVGNINLRKFSDYLYTMSNNQLNIYFNAFFGILLIFMFILIIVLLKNIYITALYIGLKIAYKKHNKEKLNKIDFKSEHYYRDIIDNLSPAMLSYIDNFKLDEKDLIAILLKLERKNKIKIGDNIEIINNNIDNLTEDERYVFNQVKNETLDKFNFIEFENEVIKECLRKDILQERNNAHRKVILKIVSNILIYIGIIILYSNSFTIFNKIITKNETLTIILLTFCWILFFIIIIYPFAIASYVKAYKVMNKINPYTRSKKGQEINYKLEGLKNYIKDYSNMQIKDKEQIELWEDYLIYSVIFGINTKVTKQILDKIGERNV